MINQIFIAISLILNLSFIESTIDKSTWMSKVPDDQSLSLMTIPGTHDSGARDGEWFSKCQTMTISDQLNYGIRFLDIRCKVQNGNFAIHHGIISEHMDFINVLNPCVDFLTKNPSETILMSIQQEESKVSSQEFIAIFNKYMAMSYRNMTYGDIMFFATSIPSLHQVRGKVVIVSRVEGLPGIQWSDMDVQDNYDLADIGTSGKWTVVENQLQKAAQEHSKGSQTIFVNFASGCSYKLRTWAFPSQVAQVINKNLDTYFNSTKCAFGDICYYGIVPMDFPGKYDAGVTDLLIRQNKNVGC